MQTVAHEGLHERREEDRHRRDKLLRVFRPIVDIRARIYDLAHEAQTQDVMSYVDPRTGRRNAGSIAQTAAPRDDWRAKRLAVDTVLDDVKGDRYPRGR
ncbi:MAG: hypothetical protein R2855_10070 [Thermomicrobiales bacterium]